jgi:uncharacterized membrane protein
MGLASDLAAGVKSLPRFLWEHKVQTVIFALLLAFALALVLAPLALPAHTVDFGPDGVVGDDEHAAEISEMENPVVRLMYQAGDANCHQIDERSFYLNGNQMPFCSRCTAIFLGLPLGMLAFYIVRRAINPMWLLLSFVPIGIDGLTQAVTSYESNNILRVITGGVAGLAAGYALGFLISEISAIATARSRPPP